MSLQLDQIEQLCLSIFMNIERLPIHDSTSFLHALAESCFRCSPTTSQDTQRWIAAISQNTFALLSSRPNGLSKDEAGYGTRAIVAGRLRRSDEQHVQDRNRGLKGGQIIGLLADLIRGLSRRVRILKLSAGFPGWISSDTIQSVQKPSRIPQTSSEHCPFLPVAEDLAHVRYSGILAVPPAAMAKRQALYVNSRRLFYPLRLKHEFSDLPCDQLNQYIRVSRPPQYGMNFAGMKFRNQLKGIIEKFQPDIFVVDPWNHVARDSKEHDYQEAFQWLSSVLPTCDQ